MSESVSGKKLGAFIFSTGLKSGQSRSGSGFEGLEPGVGEKFTV